MLRLEVAIPPPTMDFDFNDARPMPFLSAPSTPRRLGDFSLSAPSSPSRIAEFYRSFDEFEDTNSAGFAFNWEETPGTPRSPSPKGDEFAFDFRSELEETSLSAEDLFDGGKIKPLKPPPRLQYEDRSPLLSPRSPRSPLAQGKKMIREAFSPRKKKDYSDPFATAAENTRNQRGRDRSPVSLTSSASRRRAARSLSPYRVSEYPWEEEEIKLQDNAKEESTTAQNSKTASSSVSQNKSSSRKWRLKDLLLFRSASEGRASDKDYKLYPSFFRKPEDAKNSSFRSNDSTGSGSSGSRKKGQVSAHELHYKTNKAASEYMKKKTYLPYKPGILGRFAF